MSEPLSGNLAKLGSRRLTLDQAWRYAFNISIRKQRLLDLCELEASLAYIASSRSARAT